MRGQIKPRDYVKVNPLCEPTAYQRYLGLLVRWRTVIFSEVKGASVYEPSAHSFNIALKFIPKVII